MKSQTVVKCAMILCLISACKDGPVTNPVNSPLVRIAYLTNASEFLYSVNPATGTNSSVVRLTGVGTYVALLPGGRSALYIDHQALAPSDSTIVRQYDWNTSQVRTILVQPANQVSDFSFAALGGRAAYVEFDSVQMISQVCIVNLDGTAKRYLTTTRTFKRSPVWSPDGQTVVFGSGFNNDADIWSARTDGTNLTALTTNPGFDGDPCYSPSGTQIAFSSFRGGKWAIFRMNADGSNQAPLTSFDSTAYRNDPAWSPDGVNVAYIQNGRVYLIRSDGTSARQLSFEATGVHFNPRWTPDGRQIVYYSNSNGLNLFIVNSDGTNQHQLTFLTSAQSGSLLYYDICSVAN